MLESVHPLGGAGHVQPAFGNEPVQTWGLGQLEEPVVTKQLFESSPHVARSPPRHTFPAPPQSPGGAGQLHVVCEPHCPSVPQVSMCMVSEQRVMPGLQTPPQVIPTHAFGQSMVEPH